MRAFKSDFILALLLLIVSPSVWSIQVEDLYVAEVLVPEKSQNPLPRGAREGLTEVLIRISGTTAVVTSQILRTALANVDDYYYQYSFDSTDKTLKVDGEEVPARLLRIHFEPSAVARLLRRGGFPVWGSNRPTTLLWIALDDGTGRRLVAESDPGELIPALQRQARRRGLPLLYPLLDLEDDANISPAAVWGFFLDRVVEASRRYNPDSILTGRVQRRDDGTWSAHWSWHIENRWKNIDDTAPDVDTLAAHIIDRLADDLVDRYAIGSSRGFVWLQVENVDSLEDYAGASQYLSQLMPILDSQVTEVKGDEVLFRLDTEGESSQLVEIIELDKKMVLMNPTAVDQESILRFRWID